MNRRASDKNRCYIRMIVAAYIAYLGISILKGIIKGEESGPVLIIAAVAFIVIGVGYALFSLRLLLRILKEEKEYESDIEAGNHPVILNGEEQDKPGEDPFST